MKKNKNVKALIINIFIFCILMLAIYLAYQFYQSNNFNGFIRSETNLKVSEFKRDKKVKCHNNYENYNKKNCTKRKQLIVQFFYVCTSKLKGFTYQATMENTSGIAENINLPIQKYRKILIHLQKIIIIVSNEK